VSVQVETPPSGEPIVLADAKNHLGVTISADDTLISSKLTACRQFIEEQLGLALLTQTLVLRRERFPWGSEELLLPYPPLQSITSVEYVDSAGDTQSLTEDDDFLVDIYSSPGRIVPVPGTVWPTTRAVPNAVTIEYIAGFGDASAVPEILKQAILLILGDAYEHRETVIIGPSILKVETAMAFDRIAAQWEITEFDDDEDERS